MITTKYIKKNLRFIVKEVNFDYRGKSYHISCHYNKSTGITIVKYYMNTSDCDCKDYIFTKIYHTRVLDVNFHIKKLVIEMKEGVVQC